MAQQNAEMMAAFLKLQSASITAPSPAPILRSGFPVRDLWKVYYSKWGHKKESEIDDIRRAKIALSARIPSPDDPDLLVPFGDIECSRVTSSMLDLEGPMRNALKAMKSDKYDREFSPATRNRIVMLICAWFTWAHDTDDPLPCPVRRIKNIEMESEEYNIKEGKVSDADVDKFLNHPLCQPLDRALFLLLHDNGFREMEAINIAWTRFNHQSGEFRLKGGETKAGKPRLMRLSGRSLRALLALPRNGPQVFWNPKPSSRRREPGPYSESYLYRRFRTIIEAAGIKGPIDDGGKEQRVTFHTLRHTFAYKAREMWGIPREIIKLMLGHSTDAAFDRYGRPDDEAVLSWCDERDKMLIDGDRIGPKSAQFTAHDDRISVVE